MGSLKKRNQKKKKNVMNNDSVDAPCLRRQHHHCLCPSSSSSSSSSSSLSLSLSLSLMAMSPKHLPGNLPDFRAPPPSPIGPGVDRRSLFINEEELTEFLEHSLQVPDLILPDRIFPKEISTQNPPEIDFNSLISTEIDSISKVVDLFSAIGCFQLLNHGISSELIESVLLGATGVFAMSPEKKAIVSRSLGNRYGFEDLLEDKVEMEMMSEEFVWCRNEEGLKSVMEGIWSDGYSNFSQKLETLSTEIEKVASKVFMMLSNNTNTKPTKDAKLIRRLDDDGLVCCLYKHCRNTPTSQCDNSLRSDVIRILMKGSDYSHALCIHLCDGSSEFHLYSKKGWVSFCPSRGAIVVTIGDQIQAWSGGHYKHVIGRPIFKEEAENNISMDFLYSPPNFNSKSLQGTEMKIFSLKQQFILAMFLTLVYHFIF